MDEPSAVEENVAEFEQLDEVEQAFRYATEDASIFMVEMARERAQARNDRSMRVDDRATQVAAIQFAAAAIAATIGGDHTSQAVLAIASLASAVFAVGGIWALWAARADPVHLPGLPAGWWVKCVNQTDGFGRRDALAWAAVAMQKVFQSNTDRAAKRARQINNSLFFGFAGAVLVAISAFCRLKAG